MLSHRFIFLPVLPWILAAVATPAQASEIQWVDCSKHVPSPATFLNTTAIDLSALPSTLHCGRIEVPMDYSKPISPSNNITLGLAMYRPPKPKGVIFFCPGGTDAGAAAAWRVALNQTGPFFPNFSGLEDFDLMMMDIRGTWSSNILNVSLEAAIPVFSDPYPTTQSEYNAIRAASKKMIQSFVDSSSPPGIVQFTGTREVVQDYETIRKALDYEKIHFLGLSYGSYRAAQYAATFPERVGHFVLDAVTPHGLSLFDQAQSGIAAANRALLRADAFCQNTPSCPFRSQGKGSVPAVFTELLAATKNSSSETFGVQSIMSNAIADQPDFPDLFEDLEQLMAGNTSYFNSNPTIAVFVGIPYICSDYSIEDNSFSGFQKSFQAASKLDTYRIGQAEAFQVQLFCSAWPYPTAPLKAPTLKAPMLLVTADFDASTPTEWATFAWKQAPNSALVVRHGDDHTTFNLPGNPATLIEKEFLRTGILPPVQNKTFVTVYHPGMRRAPIANPYDVPTGFAAGDCTVHDECNLN